MGTKLRVCRAMLTVATSVMAIGASQALGQDSTFDPSGNAPATTTPKGKAAAPAKGRKYNAVGGGGEKSVGNMYAPVTSFSNMEKGYHILERGYRAILKNGNGMVASGKMNIKAAIKGKGTDSSGAYQAIVLNIALQYVSGAVQSGTDKGGSGTLSFCMQDSPKATADSVGCQQVAGGFQSAGSENEDRIYQMIDCPVTYSVEAGGKIRISNYDCLPAGNEGSASAIGVSLHHPVFGFAAKNKSFKDYQSPLVLDLEGDGLNLVDVYDDTKKIDFDLEGDGIASRTGWVKPTDGLLVLDINGNGVIDDGRELFSNFTYDKDEPNAGPARRFDNGFAALNQYDSNLDGRIDAQDTVFGKLQVWKDLNQNGKAEPNELFPLAKIGITEISLAYEKTSNTGNWQKVAGNEVRYTSTFKFANGTSREIADVYFKQRRNLEARASHDGVEEAKK